MAIYIGNQKVSVKGGLPVEVIEEVGEQVDFTLANATESDVLSGKTFYAQDSTLKTGTLEMASSGENKLAQLVDGTLTEITASDLQGATNIRKSAFAFFASLKKVEIPSTVLKINANAFSETGITEMIIPDTVLNLDTYNFSSCRSLTNVVIGSGVKTIPNYCFYYCSSLRNLTIPSQITSIGTNALWLGGYGSEATLIMKSTTPPTIQSQTLWKSIEKIIVPKGYLSAYQSATNWASYASKMEEAE